ncbi:MAG TPA: M14 family metallopeptidase [Candidatus Saccharimonadales bacterium]|nr:M14 family metallopeptidase [Candidatus Saccharimonadales bacterium]
MNIHKRLVRWAKDAWALPLVYRVPAMVFLGLVLLYIVIFAPSKQVVLSYAAKDTCVSHFTLLPGVLQQSGDGRFRIRAADAVTTMGVPLFATKACITPAQAPVRGVYDEAVSWGGVLFKKTFAITVGAPPVASLGVLNEPIPSTRPLVVPFSAKDGVFDYKLTIGTKSASCAAHEQGIVCDVPALKLRQGKAYRLQLERFFGKESPEVIADQKIRTLAATKVVKTSVKPGETIYSKPRTFTLIFDKALRNAKAELYLMDGKKKQPIKMTSIQKDKTLTVKLAADLPRSKTFSLNLAELEAVDGSGLEKPYTLGFRTSGGPRVTGVSTGTTGVPLGATIAISFDQTLSSKQDISGLVQLSGGAVYAGASGNQLFVRLVSVPRCGDFSIRLASGITSQYDIGGNSAWSFSGRTVCHTTQTIGYSASGRPIVAYIFGSGSAVLFTGAIHGNEIGTRALMYYWIDELEANARSIPAGRSVVVVPEINPDGVAAGTRTNAHNVDLNRNFATSDWRKDITDVNNNPFPGGGGSSAMSEPETRVIAGYAASLRPSLIVSYHSIGGVVAANQAGASGAYAATYSRLSGYGNVTGQSGETFDYSISGTADDYYAQKLGIASVLVELSSHSSSQSWLNRAAMWAMLR